jgi:hypothetical protein
VDAKLETHARLAAMLSPVEGLQRLLKQAASGALVSYRESVTVGGVSSGMGNAGSGTPLKGGCGGGGGGMGMGGGAGGGAKGGVAKAAKAPRTPMQAPKPPLPSMEMVRTPMKTPVKTPMKGGGCGGCGCGGGKAGGGGGCGGGASDTSGISALLIPKAMSRDGSVHPLSSSTMHLLANLLAYSPTVDWLLAGGGPRTASPSMQQYVRSVLDTLNASLNHMAADHVGKHGGGGKAAAGGGKDGGKEESEGGGGEVGLGQAQARSLSALFLLNNYSYIKQSANWPEEEAGTGAGAGAGAGAAASSGGGNESDGFSIRSSVGSPGRTLRALVGEQLLQFYEQQAAGAEAQYYCQSWGSLEPLLAAPSAPPEYQKGGALLTVESGRVLKRKFEGFNNRLAAFHG